MSAVRYIFIALVLTALLLSFRRSWVIRGSGVLRISLLFATTDAVSTMLFRTTNWLHFGLFWVIPIAVGFFARNSWVVSMDAKELEGLIEHAARCLWLPFTKSESVYDFQRNGVKLQLGAISLGRGYATLTFSSGRRDKKMVLLRGLLYKKFPSLFPRPTFRL